MNAAPPETGPAGPSSLPAPAPERAALTLKQQAVYDMKVAGKTRKEIAHILGISEPVVSKTLQSAYRKLGLTRRQRPGRVDSTEFTNPEVAAAAIEAAADPSAPSLTEAINRVNAQLKAAGLPDKVSERLIRRLRVKYADAVTSTRELKTNEILQMLGQKIDLAAFYLDDKVMAEASARDLMLGAGVLIEKRNLLRGEPTQILSDKERKTIHELMPELLAEAKRRGLTVDGQVTGKTSEPA